MENYEAIRAAWTARPKAKDAASKRKTAPEDIDPQAVFECLQTQKKYVCLRLTSANHVVGGGDCHHMCFHRR